MYIVGFNGPPYSGKDTLARMLAEHMDSQQVVVPVIEVSLSTPLRRFAYMLVGEVYNPVDRDGYSRFKETFFVRFNCTGRQLLIDVSEKFLKPCYGQGVMAKLLLNEVGDFHGVLLVRDSGFQCEVDPLVDAVGRQNLFVVQMRRATSTFEGDSREWVTHSHMSEIHNNGTLDDLRQDAASLYDNLVNQMGWTL